MKGNNMNPEKIKEWRATNIKRRSKAERTLDPALRSICDVHGWDVLIQHPATEEGTSRLYFFDFFIEEIGLVVEVDGPHHAEQEQSIKDTERDAWCKARGYRVIRIPTSDIMDNLAETIRRVAVAIGVIQSECGAGEYDKTCPLLQSACTMGDCAWFSEFHRTCYMDARGPAGWTLGALIEIKLALKPKPKRDPLDGLIENDPLDGLVEEPGDGTDV